MKKRYAFLLLIILLPLVSLAQEATPESTKAVIDVKFTTHTDAMAFLEHLGSWLYTAALAAVPIVILAGAFMFITAGGNPEKVKTGRNLIIWAIVGLAIIMASKGIIAIISGILT